VGLLKKHPFFIESRYDLGIPSLVKILFDLLLPTSNTAKAVLITRGEPHPHLYHKAKIKGIEIFQFFV
jgi:hypothetical protein